MAINILEAFTSEPEALDFILPGFLAGTVGALVAPGATGKSFFALEAAMCVVSPLANGALLDLDIERRGGGVVYAAAEDPPVILKKRIHAIGAYLDDDAKKQAAVGLLVEPIMGARLNLMDDDHLKRFKEYSMGARLIIVDTLSRVHTENENDNGAMSGLLQRLEFVAKETGAGVLFLHHIGKAAATGGEGDTQQAARGASALIDNARYAAALTKMTKNEAEAYGVDDSMRGFFVRHTVTKNNYGSPLTDCWYRRHEGGVLLPTKLEMQQKTKEKGGRRDDI